jgi:hypothetical protein
MPISIGGIKVNDVSQNAHVNMAPLTVDWAPFSFSRENITHVSYGDNGWLEEWTEIADEDWRECLWRQRK